MSDLIAQVEALEAAATPGPWTWNKTQYVHGPMYSKPECSHVILATPRGNQTPDEDARLAVFWRNTGMGLLRAAVVAEQEEYQPGNSRKCTQQGPGFERDECGKCRFCLRRKALAAVQRALEETT